MKSLLSLRPSSSLLLLCVACSGLVSCEVYPAGFVHGYGHRYHGGGYCPPPAPAPHWGGSHGGYYGGGYYRGGSYGRHHCY